MNPETGEFHEVEQKRKEAQSDLYPDEKPKKPEIDPKIKELMEIGRRHFATMSAKEPNQQHKLHPSHAELIFKSNHRPVPKEWPVYTIGEIVKIGEKEFTISKITSKDLVINTTEKIAIGKGEVIEINDRAFRVRKIVNDNYIVRPILGKVVR